MRENIFKKALLLVLVYGLTTFMPAMANEIALLNGIEISNKQNGVYEIKLQANSNVAVDKKINSRDRVVLELKNTQAAGSINTIYNNTSGIDHVIVQPASNNIKILIKGQNIASSFVTVDTDILPMGLTSNTPSTPETLTLNKSIESYSPIIEPDVVTPEVVAPVKTPINESVLEGAKGFLTALNPSWFMAIMMMIFFTFVTLKNNNQKPARGNVNIDLSSNLQNREMDMYKDLIRKEGIIGGGAPSSLGGRTQAPVNPRASYGLKEYQNSQANPTKNMTNFSKVNNANAYKKPQDLRNNVRKPVAKQAQAQQPNSNKDITRKDVAKAKNTINSIKFLESMADIYEKSGRVDLANGLHDKMRKAQLMQ